MKADPPEVAAAKVRAEAARTLLLTRATELQARLSPKTLSREAWEGAKSKGADLVEDAVDAVRARPYAATGVIAAITMFLAREPLMDLAGKLMDGVSARKKRRRTTKRKSPAPTEAVE